MTSNINSSKNSLNPPNKPTRKILDFLKQNRILILSIVLIVTAVVIVNLIVTNTFTDIFKCNYFLGSTLCEGVKFQLGPWYPFGWKIGPFPSNPWTILPVLENYINPPLESIRLYIVWNIIVVFTVVSLVLAFVVNKIKVFIDRLRTPEGRRFYLTSLNLWLLFLAIFGGLFYFVFVVPSLGK